MAKGESGRGVVLGYLKYVLGFDSLAFEDGVGDAEKRMKKAQKSLAKTAEGFTNLGATLTVGVSAPLVAAAAAAVNGAQAQAEAVAQVDAAIRSMGNAAGLSSGELSKFADQLELKSLFDADEILKKSTANLLTFGNVAGANFKLAQQAAVDLATRMNTDLQSATVLVGKALNDPVKGLTALTRVGIQFTDQQKAQIAAMTEAGNIAGAQAVIIGELNRQFGGSAAAAAQADPMREVMVKLGQAGDTIGEKLLPLIPPVTAAIVGLLDAFGSLSPEMQTFVVGAGAVAAAVGPILVGVGGLVSGFGAVLPLLTKLGPVFAIIQTALVAVTPLIWGAVKAMAAMALTPVGAVITGIALAVGAVYLAWKNWDKIKPIIDAAIGWVVNLYNQVKVWIMDRLNAVWDSLTGRIKAAANMFKWLWDVVVGHSYIPDLVDDIGAEIARLDGNMVKPVKAMTEAAAESFRQLQTDVGGILARLFPTAAAIQDVETQLQKLDEALAAKLISPQVWAAARERLDRELRALRDKAAEETNADLGLPSFEERRKDFEIFVDEMEDKLPKVEVANDNFASSFEEMSRRVLGAVEGLVGAIKGGDFFDILEAVIGVFGSLSSTGIFGKGMQDVFSGGGGFGGFRAMGGPVAAGQSYVVGENGPEWFTPKSGGYITPNGGARGQGGKPIIFDMRGAVVTQDLLDQMNAIAAGQAAQVVGRAGARMAKRNARRTG